MLSVEDRYYKLNRIMLKVLGLWPYWNSKWIYIQIVSVTLMYFSAIFVQLGVLISHECTLDVLINVLSFVFPTIFMLLMYYIYYFCSDAFKEIMEHIYCDWKFLTNKTEIEILDNYASTAKMLTKIFMFFFYIGMFGTIMSHAVPIFLDFVQPLNDTRAQKLHIDVEYFLDPDKYIYFIIVHLGIFLTLGMLTMLGVGTAIYNYVWHACAIFKIVNYRVETLVDQNVLQIPNLYQDRVIFERLIQAIGLHRRNIEYCNMVILQINKPFLIIIVIGVVSLSICMFRLMLALEAHNDIVDIFIPFLLVLGHLGYIFFGNHLGQQVTNNNAEIFDSVYSLPWYIVSHNIRKLILFLLLKGNKDVHLIVGGIFVASYEYFTTLLTSSISYFMVIYTFH